MQTNKKTISDEMFNTANAITDVSRTASLYCKLLAIKDMQIYLLRQEKLLEANIKTLEESKGESKWVK